MSAHEHKLNIITKMKDNKTDEINILFKSDFDNLKDESLDINLSICSAIPLTSTENDYNLSIGLWMGTNNDDVETESLSQLNFSNEIVKNDLNINYSDGNNSKNNVNYDNIKRQLSQPKNENNDDDVKNNTKNYDNLDNRNASFKCDDCCEYFTSVQSLKDHEQNHRNITTYKCKTCDIIFLDEINLKKHTIIHQNQNKIDINSRNAECPDCGKILKERSMWLHRKIHNDDKRFCCDHCGQKFVQKINFTSHLHLHTGGNSHSCTQCDKTFYNFSHLLRHEKYHSVARSFKCDKCEKKYKTERCLKVHSLVHLDQKPFLCKVCNKSFTSSSKLKQHSNIHTGERPYKCNYCSRDFTNFPNWLKHTRRRHKVDHKTGELLPSVSPKKINKKKSKIKLNNKNFNVDEKNQNQNDDKVKEQQQKYVVLNDNNEKKISSILSITNHDEYIMEEALAMEEDFMTNNDKNSTNNYKELTDDKINKEEILEDIKNEITNIFDNTTNSNAINETKIQVLPSVETIFTSAYQKIKNKNNFQLWTFE